MLDGEHIEIEEDKDPIHESMEVQLINRPEEVELIDDFEQPQVRNEFF